MKKEIRNHKVNQGSREENSQARSNFINKVSGLSKKISMWSSFINIIFMKIFNQLFQILMKITIYEHKYTFWILENFEADESETEDCTLEHQRWSIFICLCTKLNRYPLLFGQHSSDFLESTGCFLLVVITHFEIISWVDICFFIVFFFILDSLFNCFSRGAEFSTILIFSTDFFPKYFWIFDWFFVLFLKNLCFIIGSSFNMFRILIDFWNWFSSSWSVLPWINWIVLLDEFLFFSKSKFFYFVVAALVEALFFLLWKTFRDNLFYNLEGS